MKEKRKSLYVVIFFILVFIAHLLLFRFSLCEEESSNWLRLYLEGQEYFLGLSYAIALSFALCSFLKIKENRKKAVVGTIGGSSIALGLWLITCFLTGCCGSPMLIVYINLFGLSYLKMPKWALLLFTLVMVGAGSWWMVRLLPQSKDER